MQYPPHLSKKDTLLHAHVLEYRFSNGGYFWDGTFQIECFRQDDFEDLISLERVREGTFCTLIE